MRFFWVISLLCLSSSLWAQTSKEEERVPQAESHIENPFEGEDAYRSVDIMAKYEGGDEKLKADFTQAFSIDTSYFNAESILLIVSFIVEKDGTVKEATSLRNNSPVIVEETKRVFALLGRWTPALKNGKIVRSRLDKSIRVYKK